MKTDESWQPTDVDLDWIEAQAKPPHPVLLELEFEAAGPERIPILEIGTAIGCSALWMALSQPPDGRIVTIDPDRSRTDRARDFWRRAGIDDTRIEVINQPALDALGSGHPALGGPFDLAFIDALKDEYPAYLDAIRGRLAPGALVVADNVLWSGRTSGGRPAREGDGTDSLRQFVASVLRDDAFDGTILPVGDGLLVAAYRS